MPPEEDEFNFAGVTKEKCIEAPGYRVKESPVHFECEYVQTIRIPTGDPVSTVDIVIGRVAQVHLTIRLFLIMVNWTLSRLNLLPD